MEITAPRFSPQAFYAQADLQAADPASQQNAPAQDTAADTPAAPADGTPVTRSSLLPPDSAVPANIALQLKQRPVGSAQSTSGQDPALACPEPVDSHSGNNMDRNTAAEVLNRDFAKFDTAAYGGKQDGLVSADDLRAVRDNSNATTDQRDAATFLLDHEEVFTSLDTAQNGGSADGLIGQGDVTSYEGSIPTDMKPKELYNTSGPEANQPSLSDLQQRGWGDCYLLSSMGAMVQQNPDAIKNMIKDNGDGTYTVNLYEKDGNSYKANPVTVNANDVEVFTSNEGLPTDANNGKEVTWPAVMEAAYAKVTDSTIAKGTWPATALETLTGHDVQSYDPRTSTSELANLKSQFDSGKPIVMSSLPAKDCPDNNYGLADPAHAYTVTNVYTKDGKTYVALNNPWGYGHPQDIPLDDLKKYFDDVAIGTSN